MIWDAKDGCEHEWGAEQIHKTELQSGNPEFQRQWREQASGQSASAFCALCGAWRGSLGLEPTFHDTEVEVESMELREDLTEAEKKYVAEELRKCDL